MRKILLCSSLAIMAIACKKDQAVTDDLRGVWVETSQLIDTIDFENTITFSEPVFDLRSQQRTFNSLYYYRIAGDSIRLRSLFSSFSGFYSYTYRRESATIFSIRNFYNRPSLPNTLRFRRVR